MYTKNKNGAKGPMRVVDWGAGEECLGPTRWALGPDGSRAPFLGGNSETTATRGVPQGLQGGMLLFHGGEADHRFLRFLVFSGVWKLLKLLYHHLQFNFTGATFDPQGMGLNSQCYEGQCAQSNSTNYLDWKGIK